MPADETKRTQGTRRSSGATAKAAASGASATKPRQKRAAPQHNGAAANAAKAAIAAIEGQLAAERQRLAEVEEALERERKRADSATAALEAARQQAAGSAAKADAAKGGARPKDASPADALLPPWANPFTNLPGNLPGADMLAAGPRMALAAMKQPWALARQTGEMLQEMTRIATGQSAIEPDPKDKRFSDPMWKSSPIYRAALQTYLLWRQSLNSFVDQADLPKQDADRARFALSLVTEAVAPTNTMLGNPAAMRRLYETGGASAVRGLTHMIEDLARNGGLPSQVDMAAFEVGKQLAIAKGAVVYKSEVFELIQYAPKSETIYSRPLLCVPPQINKYYILDLAPGKSVVDYLAQHGFSVFAISWRNPTAKQRNWGFETYMKAILEASDVVREISGQETINITGACAGGMTLALTLGHLAAKGDRRFNAATFIVTVLDSNVESTMGLFASPETVAAAKLASRARGVLEGQEMARIFAWLRPNDLVWNYWVNNYLIGNEPAAFDILYWNNDTTRLPAKFHGELMDLSLQNPLLKPGALTMLGTPIDLARVKLDTFITAGITDHITPWQGCYATTQLMGGKAEFVLSNAGHIQSILNPPGNPKASYFAGADYPTDADQWLARAEKRPGSWWDRWRDWLGERSGTRVPAPAALGNARHPAGVAAPGTYVFEP
ncbi:MAG TPA: alpha/beta fold hydrolase [Ktedonobacterales bacterium]